MIHGLSVVFSKTFVDTSTEVNGTVSKRGVSLTRPWPKYILAGELIDTCQKKKTQETNQIE